ncbi:alpha/beta hydrolase [Pseudomonas sp. MWU16-30317]|uniref:alpha/beta fold hydrolase n=1 Tax=Pseudomonas sp. MWU16-30317 TaxID=2878095 RepID=UPI001CFC03B3|nr:alpha/beta hydrolase [Pseudomonas sp. MWU16-30317]
MMSIVDMETVNLYTEHWLAREGGHLYARHYPGAGPAFVLMHGFPDNLHIYDGLVPHLIAAGRRVVTFDFLGFGASDKRDTTVYGFKQQLDDLVAVVEGLQLGKVIPVAHDAAGPAAINFALAHPASVHSLCLLNTLYAATPAARLPELIELFAQPGLTALAGEIIQSPEQMGFLLNFQFGKFQASLNEHHRAYSEAFLGPIVVGSFMQQPSSARAFVALAADLFAEIGRNTARLATFENLDVPVNILWGTNDPYLTSGMAHDFKQHLPHASLTLVDAGHWLMIDEPEIVAQKMLACA